MCLLKRYPLLLVIFVIQAIPTFLGLQGAGCLGLDLPTWMGIVNYCTRGTPGCDGMDLGESNNSNRCAMRGWLHFTDGSGVVIQETVKHYSEKDLWERDSCKAQDTEKIISAIAHGWEHLHDSSRNIRLEQREMYQNMIWKVIRDVLFIW